MVLPLAEISWAQIVVLALLALLASGAIPALVRRRPLSPAGRAFGLLFALLIAAIVIVKLLPADWWPWSAIGVAICLALGIWVAGAGRSAAR